MLNVGSAKSAAEFVAIVKTDSQGRATVLQVPGHDGRSYRVILSRNGGTIEYKCLLDEAGNYSTCPGAASGTCYHGGAAVIKAAREAGARVIFPRKNGKGNYRNVVATRNLNGGTLFRLVSKTSGAVVYGLWYGNDNTKNETKAETPDRVLSRGKAVLRDAENWEERI